MNVAFSSWPPGLFFLLATASLLPAQAPPTTQTGDIRPSRDGEVGVTLLSPRLDTRFPALAEELAKATRREMRDLATGGNAPRLTTRAILDPRRNDGGDPLLPRLDALQKAIRDLELTGPKPREKRPAIEQIKIEEALETWSKIEPVQARAKGGITGQAAPAWRVDEWAQLPKGKKTLQLADYKGKTVYLYFFQAWCPGCHSHGFPALKQVKQAFKDDKDVAFVVIQTVFEGYQSNTMANGKKVLAKFKLGDIPLGLSGAKGKRSKVMTDYKTRGTPWTVIIGPDGKVQMDSFHLQPKDAIEMIRKGKATVE